MNTFRFGYRPFMPALFSEVFERQANETEVTYKPAANVRENEKNYFIELALPGFAKDEISIRFEDDILTVTAGHQVKENDQAPQYTWNEFAYKAKYERSFQLPETVDSDQIGATHENGILNITLPKKDVAVNAAKQISIA